MRVQVLVGNVKAIAMIDTGAQVTVGNLALREALAKRRGQRDQYEDVVIGITEDIQQATRVRVPSIVAGQMIVRNAELHWIDERSGMAPLVLSQLDLVLRNGLRQHALRLDATPPPQWGQRFTLRGRFSQPLLAPAGAPLTVRKA